MTFKCAASKDGRPCVNDEAGDYVYLEYLPLCAAHQEHFEASVLAGDLRGEVVTARVMRSSLGGIFRRLYENASYYAANPPAPSKRVDRRHEATVYFMRCGDYVKIGYSVDPAARLQSITSYDGTLAPTGLDLRPTQIVATEPGGYAREQALHAKFNKHRHTGEWFTEAPELTDYINQLQEAAA